MSHFVTLRTEIREKDSLLKALGDLGFTVKEGLGLATRGDQRRVEPAEILIQVSPAADIGFRKEGETYVVIADWYRIEQSSQLRRASFLADLNRAYARVIVREQAREQNLVVEEERLENGDIVLLLSERE